jgi:hypothetical protein
MEYYNQKRCFDGKGLVLPSQIVSVFLSTKSLSHNHKKGPIMSVSKILIFVSLFFYRDM